MITEQEYWSANKLSSAAWPPFSSLPLYSPPVFFLDSSGSGQAILAGACPQGTIKLQKQYMDMLFWFLANHANIQHTVTDIAHSPPSTPGLDFHEQKRRDLGSRITLNYCALADRVQFYTLN